MEINMIAMILIFDAAPQFRIPIADTSNAALEAARAYVETQVGPLPVVIGFDFPEFSVVDYLTNEFIMGG
jgi:hypothetical protein